jgi:subtilase family serine protease
VRRRAAWIGALALLALVVAALAVAAPWRSSAPADTAARGADAGAAAKRTLGPTDPGRQISVGLVLRMPHEAAMQHYIERLTTSDPATRPPYLSAAEFGRRFGLDEAAIAQLRRRLGGLGLKAAPGFAQRTSLSVTGPVARFEKLLGVHFVDYRDGHGRIYYAPVGQASVPASLRRYVSDVGGLSNQRNFRRADVPARGLAPADALKAYNVQPLRDDGFTGKGATIAIVSFAAEDPSDTRQFEREVAKQSGGPPVQHIPVDGGTTDTTSDNAGEVALDVQVVRGIAPDAQILDYETSPDTPFPPAFADMINKIVQDGRANIVTVSYGSCEPGWSPSDQALADRALAAAVARGISVFKSTGDAGAYQCQVFDPTIDRRALDSPAGSANLIDVGGTLLSVRADGTYLSEQAWSDTLERSGGGGGVSIFVPKPAWQTGPGTDQPTLNPNNRRQVPDVAAAADVDSGWLVCHEGSCDPVGGTSAATPFWAASMLLVQQYAEKQGAGKIGFANPILYRLAAGSKRDEVFHDVVRGNNRYYDAGPGWDFATGLGSPDVAALAREYTAELKAGK